MTLRTVLPILQVKDIQASIEYYTRLGFHVVRTHTQNGAVISADLRAEGATIVLSEDKLAGRKRDKVYQFTVKNVTAVWELMRDKADITWLLESADSGVREFGFRDCDGYTISFSG